jgi:hypothetical protein
MTPAYGETQKRPDSGSSSLSGFDVPVDPEIPAPAWNRRELKIINSHAIQIFCIDYLLIAAR